MDITHSGMPLQAMISILSIATFPGAADFH
jgi:hypothetical protein